MLSVYGIFNDATNELVYVGITSDPKRRYKQHLELLAKDFKDTCRLEILETTQDTSGTDEAFWINYFKYIGCNLLNKATYAQKWVEKSKMGSFGIRLPEPIILFYEEEAKSMGVSAGDRMRRILEQHMDAERKANVANSN